MRPVPTYVGPPHPNATHLVRGYDALGNVLAETWHIGWGSTQTEIGAWDYNQRAVRVEVMWLLEDAYGPKHPWGHTETMWTRRGSNAG